MLHRLEIENFYSIRDRQIIDLRADANAPNDAGRLAPLWKGAVEKAPKVVALFGANASGKSNVLKALAFITWFVRDSFSAPRGARMPFERFNDAEALQAPTSIAVHDVGPEWPAMPYSQEAKQCRYAYELTIGGGAQQVVEREALFYWPARARRRLTLFERDVSGEVSAVGEFDLKGYRQALGKILRPNASVIATLAQLDHPFSKRLWATISQVGGNILIEKQDGTDEYATRYYADHPALLEKFNTEVGRIDLGIEAMQVQQGQKGPVAMFTHQGLAAPMPLSYESHGTRQFMKMYPLVFQALETGSIAIVDELDSAIHPTLLPEILRWFHDPVRNPHNAQLWMSCQNASLLEDLTKEEVLFCKKDARGRTEVYGLRDIQSVRRTDNYYKKYLGGAYGAVPQIG